MSWRAFLKSAPQAASKKGEKETVKHLIENSVEHRSALQAASKEGEKENVKLLIENSADINLESGEYGSDLQAASYPGYKKIAELLSEVDTDINFKNRKDRSALQRASYKGNLKTVESLLKNGVDINLESGNFAPTIISAGHIRPPSIDHENGSISLFYERCHQLFLHLLHPWEDSQLRRLGASKQRVQETIAHFLLWGSGWSDGRLDFCLNGSGRLRTIVIELLSGLAKRLLQLSRLGNEPRNPSIRKDVQGLQTIRIQAKHFLVAIDSDNEESDEEISSDEDTDEETPFEENVDGDPSSNDEGPLGAQTPGMSRQRFFVKEIEFRVGCLTDLLPSMEHRYKNKTSQSLVPDQPSDEDEILSKTKPLLSPFLHGIPPETGPPSPQSLAQSGIAFKSTSDSTFEKGRVMKSSTTRSVSSHYLQPVYSSQSESEVKQKVDMNEMKRNSTTNIKESSLAQDQKRSKQAAKAKENVIKPFRRDSLPESQSSSESEDLPAIHPDAGQRRENTGPHPQRYSDVPLKFYDKSKLSQYGQEWYRTPTYQSPTIKVEGRDVTTGLNLVVENQGQDEKLCLKSKESLRASTGSTSQSSPDPWERIGVLSLSSIVRMERVFII